MTVMRSEVGKLMLDNVFRERANLNLAIVGEFQQDHNKNLHKKKFF